MRRVRDAQPFPSFTRTGATLDRYAADVLEISAALDLRGVVFVGHSVGGIIGALAANADPDRFAGLVLIGSSPRFVNDVDYEGGYSEADIADLIDNVDSNLIGWSTTVTPGVGEDLDRRNLTDDVAGRRAGTDQRIAWQFARAAFLSDHRADVARISVPTLVLQGSEDTVVPPSVARYLGRTIPRSRIEMITATGHFPNLSAPAQLAAAVHRFLETLAPPWPSPEL